MKHPEIKALVLLSEITDIDGRNFLRAHPSLPLFLATADDDADPGVSDLMQWLSTFSTNPHTRFVRYKTGGARVGSFPVQPGRPAAPFGLGTGATGSPPAAPPRGLPSPPPLSPNYRTPRPPRPP